MNEKVTVLHVAAANGHTKIVEYLLAHSEISINCENDKGQTPLFKAILHGHLDCVKALVTKGAKLSIATKEKVNVLHVAAAEGRAEILQYLLPYDHTDDLLYNLTDNDGFGFAPIHFAVSNNHADCVKLLLTKKADLINLKSTLSPYEGSTPLHIAAIRNHVKIAEILLKFMETNEQESSIFNNGITNELNVKGCSPLHSAIKDRSTDVISLLLKHKADLSNRTRPSIEVSESSIDLIIKNLLKPADFIEEVFNSCISMNTKDLQNPECKITVDYGILSPKDATDQMKLIQALLGIKNINVRKRLLSHPLVESFLYLKWKAVQPYCYIITAMYAMFVISLTFLTLSEFNNTDAHNTTNSTTHNTTSNTTTIQLKQFMRLKLWSIPVLLMLSFSCLQVSSFNN